jgi:hypothetical protein
VERDPQHLVRGTSEYRRERRFRRLANQADVLIALVGMSPREIYRGLIGHARHRRWKDGWAAHAFRELYGIWPRPQDKGEPTRPPVALEEWISTRKRRKAAA